MFDENFTFDCARSPSIGSGSTATRDSSRSVSPCSASSPFPPPRLSVGDLAAQFADQRIRTESAICYDTCETYANNDGDDAGWSIPSVEDISDNSLSRSRTFPQRPHSPSRRIQRQVNTRLLCSASHHRDIAALVSRMVDSNEQCSVLSSGSRSPTNDDEGYGSDGDQHMSGAAATRCSSTTTIRTRPEFRRSSEYKSSGSSVTKNVRQRKNDGQRKARGPQQKP